MVSRHTLRGILQTFIVNRNDPGTCPDLCEAVGSMTSLPLAPSRLLHSTVLALETRSAWGYAHVLPATHSLDCVDVCVYVCVCPGPLVYPWPPCTVITTHSCHLTLSLSFPHLVPLSLSLTPLLCYNWYDLNSGS